MRVAIPHNLDRDEVRRRMQSRSHEIADFIPGGMAEATTDWPSADRMTITVTAMGKDMGGTVDIEEAQVVLDFNLPPALSFMEPIIEGAIRKQGQKLLDPPKG